MQLDLKEEMIPMSIAMSSLEFIDGYRSRMIRKGSYFGGKKEWLSSDYRERKAERERERERERVLTVWLGEKGHVDCVDSVPR